MKRFLIIGGGGFIGRSLVSLLHQFVDCEVIITGRSKDAGCHLPEIVDYRQVRPADMEVYAGLLQWADAVVDFAHSSVPQTSFVDPVSDVLENLPFNVALIKMASEVFSGKFIFVSSGGTVYGHAERQLIDEEHPTNPLSPYGISKLAVEKYGLMYWRQTGLNFIALRPGNAFGPGQIGGRGQGFAATAMLQILEGRPVTIFGDRGTVRDYVYVDDLAAGILAAIDHAEGGAILNIGTGVGTDNRQLLDIISSIVAPDEFNVDVRILPARNFDVGSNILDSSRIRSIGGWSPVTELEVGLRKTWDWIRRDRFGDHGCWRKPIVQ